MKKLIAMVILFSSMAIAQVNNPGTSFPDPGSAGLCWVSTGATTYAWGSCSGAASAAFSAITGSTNTTAAMVIGTGASLATAGSGTIAATTSAKWAVARTLAGNSVDGSANVAFPNKFIVQGTADSGLSGAQFMGALGTGIVKNTTTTGVLSIAIAGDFPTLNQSTTGSAATLTTPRSIYGNNFDGSAALSQIIASTFGGTGNGFTKFSGPLTAEKTFTLPNASAAVLTDNAAVTVAQGGTALQTLTLHALYAGNATTAPSAIAVPAADSLLYGTTAVDPSFKALPTTGTNGCSGSGDALQWNNTTHVFACLSGIGAGGSGTVNAATQYAFPYYSAAGSATTLSGVAAPTANGFYTVGYNVTGGVALAPTAVLSGVPTNAQVGTTYTVLYSDRNSYLSFSNAGAIAVTLPQAGTTGFTSNFAFDACAIGAGTVTITPTTSTISYSTGTAYSAAQATLALTTGQCAFIYSDNSNYFAFQIKGGGGTGLADPGGNGVVVRTALNTTTNRTLTGTANQITITNGDGVSAAPTFSIASPATMPGEITLAAPTTGAASLNFPSGTAPTTPSAGDMWQDASGIEIYQGTGAGGIGYTEGAAVAGAAGLDWLYGDSTAHRLMMKNNNGTAAQVVGSGADINTFDQVTVTHLAAALPGAQGGLNANSSAFTGVLREASGTASASELSGDAATSGSNAVTVSRMNGVAVLRVVMTADWTCGTGGVSSSCTAATIVGTGGTPLTITLPSVTASYHWQCDGVVGQATAATANSWNVITATNAPTNLEATYQMNTAATAMTGGAVTGISVTTTTVIAPTWTLGGTATKMPFHIQGSIEGASASGTVISLQLVAPTVADLVTVYRGTSCSVAPF